MSPLFLLYGLVVGFLVGATGVGGGSIMTPLLVLAGLSPIAAVGVDLAYSAPTKLLGAFLHWRQRTVNWAVVRDLALGGIPAAVVGLVLLGWLRRHVDVSLMTAWTRHAIGVALILAAAVVLVRRG